MRTFAPILAVLVLASSGVAAADDPKPTKVDPNPTKTDVTVLRDGTGGTYVIVGINAYMDAYTKRIDPRPPITAFYGTGKQLYQQHDVSAGKNSTGSAWEVRMWAPKVANIHRGMIDKRADGTYLRNCQGEDDAMLSELTGDKATEVMTKYTFMTPFHMRIPHLLARDDTGVYYLVDKLRSGAGWRLLIGKKGALKPMVVNDATLDPAGELFITRLGTLKVDYEDEDAGNNMFRRKRKLTWIKGTRQMPLTWVNFQEDIIGVRMVYRDLGAYGAIGTVCEAI